MNVLLVHAGDANLRRVLPKEADRSKAINRWALLAGPFRRRTLTRKPELPARMPAAGLEEPVRPMTSL